MKLKTLNDLKKESKDEYNITSPDADEVVLAADIFDGIFHFCEDLKAEAIKWAKYIKKIPVIDKQFNAEMVWKTFFSITEEDLK